MRFAYKRPATHSRQRQLYNYRRIFHSLRRIVRKTLAEVTDFNIVNPFRLWFTKYLQKIWHYYSYFMCTFKSTYSNSI